MDSLQETIYCRKCRRPLSAEEALCPKCGWDQAKRYDAEAEKKKAETESQKQALEAKRAAEKRQREVLDASIPEKSRALEAELRRQYRTLTRWQIAGLALVFHLPSLAFLLVLFFPAVLTVAAIYPVATILAPIAALVGLLFALFRKPILRQKIAEMGVDAELWVKPMEEPVKIFWKVTACLAGLFIVILAIAYKTMEVQRALALILHRS